MLGCVCGRLKFFDCGSRLRIFAPPSICTSLSVGDVEILELLFCIVVSHNRFSFLDVLGNREGFPDAVLALPKVIAPIKKR